MSKESLKFYSMVAGGMALVAVLAVLLFLSPFGNDEEVKSEKNNTADKITSGSQYREELRREIYEAISKEDFSSEAKQDLKNRATDFISLIDKAENVASDNKAPAANPYEAASNTQPGNPASSGEISILDRPAQAIFPSYYLSYVQSMADVFKEQKFISKQREIVLEKTEDVFRFFAESLGYFLKVGAITENEYPNLRYGLTVVWPKTLEMEFGNQVSVNQPPAFNIEKELSDNIFVKFWLLLSQQAGIKEAFAQSSCFRSGGNVSQAGANLWAPCCSCYCVKVPCGCLNAVCTTGAAIFDEATGICGCG